MKAFLTAALMTMALGTSGCIIRETRPLPIVNPVQATKEIPTAQLLDVGVKLFDANVPADEKAQEKERIFPEVRKAEARFIPMQIRNTIETTGYWGQVRVIPVESNAMDVLVTGKILECTGMELRIDVTVADATGRQWYQKVYSGAADTRSYRGKATTGEPRDPFQNVYSTIANDMLAYRQTMAAEDLRAVRRVNDLRFAADIAPYAFKDYLQVDKQGRYTVERLPAEGDPLVQRLDRIRERDYALLDTLNEYYSLFSENMLESYNEYRKFSYAELDAETDAKRESIARKLLGAAAIVGGLFVGTESGTFAGQATATAGVLGGIYAVRSGFDKGAEATLHSNSLQQLSESFQSEVKPMVIEMEGRTLQLTGTAEEQYREWRRLLKELYENETGVTAKLPEAAGAQPTKK